MPISKKTGKYFMNPHEMQRHEGGDSAGDRDMGDKADKPMRGKDDPGSSGGDGAHHHEIIKHDDGMVRSVHTNPDGSKEEGEHGSYDEAKADMDAKMGEGQQDDAPDAAPMDDGGGEDMAGMYAGDCQ